MILSADADAVAHVDTSKPAEYNSRMSNPQEEQITRFLWRADDLRSRPFFKQGGGLGGSLNIVREEPEGSLSVFGQINLPDEEHVRSFLLDFRKLAVLQGSSVLVTKVCDTCYKALPADSDLRQRLVDWRRTWIQTQKQFTEGIRIGDQGVSPEMWADLWINGYYFHDDPVKRRQLEAMFGGMLALAKVNFLNYVINATREIDRLAHLVEEGVSKGIFKF